MILYVSRDSFPIAASVLRPGSQVSHSTSSAAKETSRLRWFPGLALLRSYESAWLTHDLVAGIVLTTMLAPVGIAYAVASGVGPIYGLYATIACLLAYALFGPSRILVLGPNFLIGGRYIRGRCAAVGRRSGSRDRDRRRDGARLRRDPYRRRDCSARFRNRAFVKPIRYGYMNGIALTVLISQLPKLFGFKISSAGPLRDLWSIAGAIASGKVNWVECALGAATLALILLVKSRKRFPGILVAMIAATAVISFFDLAESANISVLGSLPRGLPRFSIPWIPFADLVPVVIGGFAVSLVSFADTSVLSRTYAARTGTRVDPNQEMVGLGAANLAAGLFQGFPVSSSSSRTPVAEAAGSRLS